MHKDKTMKASKKNTKILFIFWQQKELDITEIENFKRIKAENATLLVEAEKHGWKGLNYSSKGRIRSSKESKWRME
jgi:hypothetical protein